MTIKQILYNNSYPHIQHSCTILHSFKNKMADSKTMRKNGGTFLVPSLLQWNLTLNIYIIIYSTHMYNYSCVPLTSGNLLSNLQSPIFIFSEFHLPDTSSLYHGLKQTFTTPVGNKSRPNHLPIRNTTAHKKLFLRHFNFLLCNKERPFFDASDLTALQSITTAFLLYPPLQQ